MPYWALYKVV
eukprot:gene25936-biopygen17879